MKDMGHQTFSVNLGITMMISKKANSEKHFIKKSKIGKRGVLEFITMEKMPADRKLIGSRWVFKVKIKQSLQSKIMCTRLCSDPRSRPSG